MQFGKTEHPELVDFTLPDDHPDTAYILSTHKSDSPFEVFVGCAKWNRQDLKGFYPRGTKDELTYYSTQFNAIELNATFYRSPSAEQVSVWKNKTPENFRFYPKIPNTISHIKRLLKADEYTAMFCDAISLFEEKLGISFLQLNDNFKPKDFDRLADFVRAYPKAIPLAVEVRNTEWFTEKEKSDALFELLRQEGKTAVLVDTAGRRDLLHMRLCAPSVFIRYVGANHPSDYQRLDDWVERIKQWRDMGLRSLHFFVHQNIEKESPLLSAYFIQKLNRTFKLRLKIPDKFNSQPSLDL